MAQEQFPVHRPNPAERKPMIGRHGFQTVNSPAPSVTPAPTPAPFTPTPAPTTPSPTTPGAISPPGQQQAAPSLPPTGPSVPPVVTFRDGLLTVQALNCTLGSVLTAIRNKTGIEFEGGEGALDVVTLSVGPASEGDVLAAIFSGSSFDFVALGRADSPGIVQRVLLNPNNKNGPMAGAPTTPQTPRVIHDGDEEENVPEDEANPSIAQPQDTAVQPPADPTQQRTLDQFRQRQLQLLQQQQQQQQQQPQQQQDDPASAPRKHPPQ